MIIAFLAAVLGMAIAAGHLYSALFTKNIALLRGLSYSTFMNIVNSSFYHSFTVQESFNSLFPNSRYILY